MFPDELDGAKVIMHTPEGDYGSLPSWDGKGSERCVFVAICKYDNEDSYYLFHCNADFEVLSDSSWFSVEECQQIASNSYGIPEGLWISK